MLKKGLIATMAVACFGFGSAIVVMAQDAKPAQAEKKADKRAGRKDKGGKAQAKEQEWRIAVMAYTFNRFTLMEAIDKTAKAGAKDIETFSWQKVGGDQGELKFEPTLPEEARKAVKKKLGDAGVKLVGYYFADLKDEATAKPVFEFCKDMGVQYIVSEPDPKNFHMLDKLAQEYKVKVAVHNHPKDPNKPEYKYWQPEAVMAALEGTSSWMGCCADNGHWVRSGLDPVESIRKYKGRLVSLHLKDVNEVGPKAHDVPYGTGVVKLKDFLSAVKEMGFSGVFAIEYEHNMENNQADVAQCIEWFNKEKAELKVK